MRYGTVHYFETGTHRYFTSWHTRGPLKTKADGCQPGGEVLRSGTHIYNSSAHTELFLTADTILAKSLQFLQTQLVR